MALKAVRTGGNRTARTANRPNAGGTQPMEEQVQNQAPAEETQANNVPAPSNVQTPASPARGGNNLADLNAGVLDNIDDMNFGGNYVTMDGSEFLFKDTNETAKEIDIVVSYGKRFYQWYDEDNQQYHNSDTKLDDRYKMKFEIRWFEEAEEGEPKEYIMTLPTASAMNFINYVKNLAKNGLRVNQVITRLTISRQQSQDGKFRFSRTEFENVGTI